MCFGKCSYRDEYVFARLAGQSWQCFSDAFEDVSEGVYIVSEELAVLTWTVCAQALKSLAGFNQFRILSTPAEAQVQDLEAEIEHATGLEKYVPFCSRAKRCALLHAA